MARKSATIRNHTLSKGAAIIVAGFPLAPAIMVNVETAANGSLGWTLAAIGSVVMAAVFIHAARTARSILFALAGIACFAGNLQNAIINASAVSDHRATDRRMMISDASKAKAQRELWTQSRNQQAITAGNTSVAEYDAQLEHTIASDAMRWRQTEQCAADKITLNRSQEFCASIAALRGKRAAAIERDKLDRQIAELDDHKLPDTVTVDPYADTIVKIAAIVNVDIKAHTDIIGRFPAITKPVILEIMATFGPTAVLAVAAYLFGWQTRSAPAAPPARHIAQTATGEPTQALAVPSGDLTHAFIAECLEPSPGSIMPAGEVWQLWNDWCAKRGEQTGSRKAFGTKLKTMVASEKNNNRPRYLNVRAK